jgi:hypothetical protein
VSPEFRTIEKYAGRLEEWKAGAGVQARLEAGDHTWEAGTGVQATDIQGWVEGLAEVDHTSGRYPLDAMQAQTDRQTLDRYLYCQGLWHVGRASLAEGLRLSHFDATGEFVVLPRLSLECLLRPGWTLGLAAGRYAQPPLYGEFLGKGGPSRLKAQRADQASLGLDGQMGPASTWRTEVYCRWLRNLVSYSVDDVRVVYSGTNDAKGYAYGMSTLWRGQIAQLVGLISYSYLVTREDLAGDGRGYLPRPTDQRHTASAYLEDQVEALRWKWLGASRFHLRALYGSGFPYTPKVADTTPGLALVDGPRNSRRDHPYFRFDLGLAQTVYLGEWQLQVQEEVGNVFDQYNVVAHTYLPTSASSPVELRHALGRRVYNVALSARY